MIINNNIPALNTFRQMGVNQANGQKAMEKLASGLRINKAGDDAAGLSISEKMRSQIRGLDQAARNAQDGISMIQTAEGALNEVHSIAQRMRELAVQGANDTNNDSDRAAILDELNELETEINRISKTTEFNGKKLLNGDLSAKVDASSDVKVGVTAGGTAVVSSLDVSRALADETYTISTNETDGTITLTRESDDVSQKLSLSALTAESTTFDFNELGVSFSVTGTATVANLHTALNDQDIVTATGDSSAAFLIGTTGGADQTISIAFDKYDASTIGNITSNDGSDTIDDAIDKLQAADGLNKANFENLVSTMDRSIEDISKQRSLLGASQNRLEHTISNLNMSSENLQAAESRIRDVDMAREVMEMTKNNILSQASQAMLAQANQAPQAVLQLLG
ncbi:flagellin [Evansella tamaricis]|uniref:Flagellin n=1 Tax=Evansella tamaricis TaxID=2069301 RepID=A0ABS6JHD7_9BACI|nr:flagellin [Evansella tamaricis]MBU9711758.1 flagellin [Evansella tamaricis]